MAIFRGDIRSTTLGMDTGIQVILPHDRPNGALEGPCRTLYLLHGLGDNCAAWARYTCIEQYARSYNLAVVMPEVQRGFYMDLEYGISYFTYITEELPRLCAEMFPLSGKREDTFVAGLSMGGYGAMKCGLSRPDLYAACASFSGALDIEDVLASHYHDERRKEFTAAFGQDLSVLEKDNLMILATKLAKMPTSQVPRIYFTCGQQDFLYGQNQRFKSCLDHLDLPYRYEEWPGDHEWSFWDKSIKKALAFFLDV